MRTLQIVVLCGIEHAVTTATAYASYTVLVAANADEALRLFEVNAAIDVLSLMS